MRTLQELPADEIKAAVAARYGEVALSPRQKFNFPVGRAFAESVGYDAALLETLPGTMWESFTGAGNPQPFVDAARGGRPRPWVRGGPGPLSVRPEGRPRGPALRP